MAHELAPSLPRMLRVRLRAPCGCFSLDPPHEAFPKTLQQTLHPLCPSCTRSEGAGRQGMAAATECLARSKRFSPSSERRRRRNIEARSASFSIPAEPCWRPYRSKGSSTSSTVVLAKSTRHSRTRKRPTRTMSVFFSRYVARSPTIRVGVETTAFSSRPACARSGALGSTELGRLASASLESCVSSPIG